MASLSPAAIAGHRDFPLVVSPHGAGISGRNAPLFVILAIMPTRISIIIQRLRAIKRLADERSGAAIRGTVHRFIGHRAAIWGYTNYRIR
jgi:hypothetical protein